MLETAFFTLSSQVVSDICLDTGVEKGTNVISWVGQAVDGKFKQLIYNWSKRYVENYAKRHGILKVLGMSEPIDLDSIYTKVCLLSDRDVYKFASVDGLEEIFRETRSFQQSDETEKPIGLDVANKEQYLMVLGAPGAGKSTLLRKIGLEALKGKEGDYHHNRIPVFLELKRFNQADIDIVSVIAKEFEICKHPRPKEYAEAALDDGKLVVLFDGLDEVPTELQNNVINAIEDFVDRYDKNRFVASCRVAAYNTRFRRFRDVAIANFDGSQIEQFIRNWFRSEQDQQMETGQKCWELLSGEKHRGAKELAQTPLLLTFLCLVYDRSQTFPENRSQLYSKALRILLEEWAASKRLSQDKIIYAGLHTELEEELLTDIAYWGFQQDQLFFQKDELVAQIRKFLTENLNADKTLNGEAILKAIAVQQGIFVERAENIYSFSHLTLQEYLTAKYIVDNNCIEETVEQHITDYRWKEVFILVAGLAKGRAGADPLLLAIEKYALNYTKSPTGQKFLVPWMEWAVKATTGSKSDLSPTAKRSVAIANAYAYAFNYAYADDYADPDADSWTLAFMDTEAYRYAEVSTYPYVSLDAELLAMALMCTNVYKSHFDPDTTHFEVAIDNFIKYCQVMDKRPLIFTSINFEKLAEKFKLLRQNIPAKYSTHDEHISFSHTILKTLFNLFDFPEKSTWISEKEVHEIDQKYFYPYKLMLDCQVAAVRVSSSTWQAIEERMFLPPEN